MPSRRFYVAMRAEFQDLRRTKGKALRLSRKRKGDELCPDEDEEDEEGDQQLTRIAQDLETVCRC